MVIMLALIEHFLFCSPAMPADLVAPVSPMSNRAYNDYGSPDSTLSMKSSNDGASGGMSQEFVVR